MMTMDHLFAPVEVEAQLNATRSISLEVVFETFVRYAFFGFYIDYPLNHRLKTTEIGQWNQSSSLQ